MRFSYLLAILSLAVLASAYIQEDDFLAYKSEDVTSGPYTFVPFPDIVKPLGYPVETHKITTEDGYILTFFRIQAKNQTSLKSGLPVVYLQHGLLDSCDSMVLNDEDKAPGLILANAGYDVWLGNVRGNKYSMEHTTLNPKKKEFWQFSWQNMSQYDLPAAFEYINLHTSQNVTYIGHSQGTTIMYAALADRVPGVLKYLKKYIAWSPSVFEGHATNGPALLAAKTPLVELYEAAGIHEACPPNFLQSAIGHAFCKVEVNICGDLLGVFFGANPEYDNKAKANVLLQHFPSGTSVMNLKHWRQMVNQGRYAKFDYGTAGNLQHYGQPGSPDYNLTNINVPVHMFFGLHDSLVDATDSQILLQQLVGTPNPVYKEYPSSHITWLLAKDISFYWGDLMTTITGN